MSLLIGIVGLILVGGYIFLFMEREVPGPPGWPPSVKLYRKQALGGLTRVVDQSSGQVLFMYWPEYDRYVHPTKIEKIDDRHWQVIFEAPPR